MLLSAHSSCGSRTKVSLHEFFLSLLGEIDMLLSIWFPYNFMDWGRRAGSAVKGTCCFSWGLEFSDQSSVFSNHIKVQNHLLVQFQRDLMLSSGLHRYTSYLSASMHTHIHIHTHIHSHKLTPHTHKLTHTHSHKLTPHTHLHTLTHKLTPHTFTHTHTHTQTHTPVIRLSRRKQNAISDKEIPLMTINQC